MKGNNEKRKWYFLIAVALIVGAIIGYFATQSLSTTGNAKNIANIQDMYIEEENGNYIRISGYDCLMINGSTLIIRGRCIDSWDPYRTDYGAVE